jgi:ADP-ribose pyrophosphatase YjhB (NUDIX family)
MPKIMTLSFLLTDNEICLAMKKRGFGEGNWNGYGGKVEEESIETAAVREIKEESGVAVNESDLQKVALVDFIFEDGKHLLVHTYFVREWSGEPIETEEMKPRWYAFDAIPYDLMWADDIHWLPRVLRDEKLRGTVYFNADGETIKDMEWKVVEGF